MATYKDNMTIKEIRWKKNSLVLKNLEIRDKVTHSQAIACSFGGVGRTDTLFGGSQTGEKWKPNINNYNKLFIGTENDQSNLRTVDIIYTTPK